MNKVSAINLIFQILQPIFQLFCWFYQPQLKNFVQNKRKTYDLNLYIDLCEKNCYFYNGHLFIKIFNKIF